MALTHLFVDTNVFLNFYSYAKDDLSQLKKLIENLSANEIVLHLPQQVLNELERNREMKLKTSADQFRKENFPTAIPRHMQDYPQAKLYSEAVDAALKARVLMINQAAAEGSGKALAADKVLEELVGKANVYAEDDSIFQRAVARMQKGNPPGKPGSVGDQYNWEYLLEYVPDEDLHIVSKDGDYVSGLNTGRPHPFLEKEWNKRKHANLHVYSELRPFIDKYLAGLEAQVAAAVAQAHQVEPPVETAPAIPPELAPPIAQPEPAPLPPTVVSPNPEKTTAMEDLIKSTSFSGTHSAVAKLEELRSTLSTDDVEKLLSAALANNQISWIASDSDVFAFFTAVLGEHPDVDAGLAETAAELFGLIPDVEDMDPNN
jgi:predicted nucleic acid-binding protein